MLPRGSHLSTISRYQAIEQSEEFEVTHSCKCLLERFGASLDWELLPTQPAGQSNACTHFALIGEEDPFEMDTMISSTPIGKCPEFNITEREIAGCNLKLPLLAQVCSLLCKWESLQKGLRVRAVWIPIHFELIWTIFIQPSGRPWIRRHLLARHLDRTGDDCDDWNWG